MAKLLEMRGLTTRVAGFTILNRLDFSIDENELQVVLGPNGAGRTTLISMIGGQYRPTAGKIYFAGEDITGMAPDRIFQKGISRVPGAEPHETLSVFDNVMISLQGGRKVFRTLWRRVTAADRSGSGAFSSSWTSRSGAIPPTGFRMASSSGSNRHADRIQPQAAAAR